MVLQLVQVQALRANLIMGVFKATLAQSLNIKIYLTFIGLELDKKTDQAIVYLCSGLLYHTLTQNWFLYPRRIFTPFEVLEKYYARLFRNNICKVESKPAYVISL